MKFNFTTRGLFLVTTFVSILMAIVLWIGDSPLLIALVVYAFFYLGLFGLLYVYRYQHQIRVARLAWKQHKATRTAMDEEIKQSRAKNAEAASDCPPKEGV